MTELKNKLEELFLKILESHISRLSSEDKPPIRFPVLTTITKYVKFLEEFKIQEDPDIVDKIEKEKIEYAIRTTHLDTVTKLKSLLSNEDWLKSLEPIIEYFHDLSAIQRLLLSSEELGDPLEGTEGLDDSLKEIKE